MSKEKSTMDCHEAAPFVSVLHDGEHVPSEFADHIDACPSCRASLRDYSQMGAELRLLASRTPADSVLPQGVLQKVRSSARSDTAAFWKRSMLVPRFAVVAAAAAFVAVSAGLMVVRAQSEVRPLWFQFELLPGDLQGTGGRAVQNVAQAGYDQGLVSMSPVLDANHRVLPGSEMQTVGTHVAISAIKDGHVQLAVRSRRYQQGDTRWLNVQEDLRDLKGHSVTYAPGQTLQIPIEGGGVLMLRGSIVDHQPKFAWGLPVEPAPDQIVLNHPVLIRGNTLLANIEGGSALAEDYGSAFFSVKNLGQITVSLRPLPGSIKGEASWGKLAFKLDGESYTVFSASPITGGEQPHAVWVRLSSGSSLPEGTIGGSSGATP